MEFADSMDLNAPCQKVWDTLSDAQTVGRCIPGLQTLEIYEEGRSFGGETRISVGSSSLKFPARVTWLEQNAPHGGRLQAVVTVAGYEIEGAGEVLLTELGNEGTRLSWEADVVMPEKLADNVLVKQMAKMFATRFIQDFFHCLQSRLASV